MQKTAPAIELLSTKLGREFDVRDGTAGCASVLLGVCTSRPVRRLQGAECCAPGSAHMTRPIARTWPREVPGRLVLRVNDREIQGEARQEVHMAHLLQLHRHTRR